MGVFVCVLCLMSLSLSLQEPQVVLGCVQLLQSLSQHRQHLKDLPTKTMMDILTEVTAAAQLHLESHICCTSVTHKEV